MTYWQLRKYLAVRERKCAALFSPIWLCFCSCLHSTAIPSLHFFFGTLIFLFFFLCLFHLFLYLILSSHPPPHPFHAHTHIYTHTGRSELYEEGDDADEDLKDNLPLTLAQCPAGGLVCGTVVTIQDYTQELTVRTYYPHFSSVLTLSPISYFMLSDVACFYSRFSFFVY